MRGDEEAFDALVRAAEQQRLVGWDFSWVDDRVVETPPPWSYQARATTLLRAATAVLDLGTGGGERLASLAPLPAHAVATEAYPPNVPVARARLEPLGVEVRQVTDDELLPVADAEFDLVLDRHTSFSATEVARALRPGGTFLTQQVGHGDLVDLDELLGLPPRDGSWRLEAAVAAVTAAGLEVVEADEALLPTRIHDVGALVFLLRALPWQFDGFDLTRHRPALLAAHGAMTDGGPLEVRAHRFLLEAGRPAA